MAGRTQAVEAKPVATGAVAEVWAVPMMLLLLSRRENVTVPALTAPDGLVRLALRFNTVADALTGEVSAAGEEMVVAGLTVTVPFPLPTAAAPPPEKAAVYR